MNQFISLPSGLRINTAHILHYRGFNDDPSVGYTLITMDAKDGTGDLDSFRESMSPAELDALLNPHQSAMITESVVNLDMLKPLKPCCWTKDGIVRHGVIDYFNGEGVYVAVSSNGHAFTIPIETI